MLTKIVNCTWKFELQCPRQWTGLRKTSEPKVRLCEACLREVHWCENDDEVGRLAAEGACVAVGLGEPETDTLTTMGRIIARDKQG
jgi:hypothetical protein